MPNLFRRISWGFLFVILDFRIGGFDILPDPVGFLLIFTALLKLPKNPNFLPEVRKLYWFAASVSLLMLPLSVFDFFRMLAYEDGGPLTAGWLIMDGTVLLLLLALIYWLVTGMEIQAGQDNLNDLAITARFRKWFACVFILLLLFLNPFVLNGEDVLGFMVVVMLFVVAAQFFILLLCRKAANVYERVSEKATE